jgi:hypothetical protein
VSGLVTYYQRNKSEIGKELLRVIRSPIGSLIEIKAAFCEFQTVENARKLLRHAKEEHMKQEVIGFLVWNLGSLKDNFLILVAMLKKLVMRNNQENRINFLLKEQKNIEKIGDGVRRLLMGGELDEALDIAGF